MADGETPGAIVDEAIASSIDAAEERAEQAEAVADAITESAIRTAQFERINDIDRRFSEWESQQAAQAEILNSLTLATAEQAAKMELLTQAILPPTPSQNASAADGPRENQEAAPEVTIEETIEAPEPEATAEEPDLPKRKKFRLI